MGGCGPVQVPATVYRPVLKHGMRYVKLVVSLKRPVRTPLQYLAGRRYCTFRQEGKKSPPRPTSEPANDHISVLRGRPLCLGVFIA